MCGRYQLVLPLEALQDLFDFENAAEPFPPRYNIAPTQPIHVVHHGPRGRSLTLMRWGFLPAWVKDTKAFPLIINARSETAVEKPAFRNAIRRRRALIPATGFYEWRMENGRKQPFYFEPAATIAFAGIYETWSGPDGEELDTAAILTAQSTGVPAEYHDRMPLTVAPENYAAWLDPMADDGAAALALTGRESFSARPVSMKLSNARNEGAGLMTPEPEAPPKKPTRRQESDAPRLL
ncbi:MAG: SOS response-associated peptidase [Pseudomonadota bacterium]